MATIKGSTGNSYCMYDKGKAYPLSLNRKLKDGEYPTKIEFATLTGSPNSYYASGYASPYNKLDVYLCDSSGGRKHKLFTVDYNGNSTTFNAAYNKASVDAKDLAGAELSLLGEGRDGCYLRNICQVTITTSNKAVEQAEPPTNPDIFKDLISEWQDSGNANGLARRGTFRVKVQGVDITQEINDNLISMEITDNEEDEADDLQLTMHDKDAVWLQTWLDDTIHAGAKTKGLRFTVWIGAICDGKIAQQKNGKFELDSVRHSGPPSKVVIKCISLGFKGGIRTEERSKSWEGYTLKGIAEEIASKAHLKVMYCSNRKIRYNRKEQNEETDIAFLKTLCQNAGFALKITDRKMILIDKTEYEKRDAIGSITYGDGSYTKWDVSTTTGDVTYDCCTVRWTNPRTGKVIEGKYKTEEWEDNEPDDEDDEDSHQELLITNVKVASVKEAEELAEMRCNLANRFEKTATFTLPGNPTLMAGLTFRLKNFGFWSGKYMISNVKHTISSSGYNTQIKLRKI